MDSLAAIGLGLHSGWASAVLMAEGSAGTPGLVARRRIILCEEPQAKQPYHAAESMKLGEAEAFIEKCRAATVALAARALMQLREEAAARDLAGIGLAASPARELPPLDKVLHSHALIHAAEGVFYRETVIDAGKRLGLEVHVITGRAAADFLSGAGEVREALEQVGKRAGPPWTIDEKCASLAALALLPGPAQRFHLETLGQPTD